MRYRVVSTPVRHQIDIQRSVFIADVARAASADEAKSFIQEIRNEFPGATHHCWAFQTGPPGDTRDMGYSDDGEPHGTAGKPMLQVLMHSGLGELVAVVTRYYGGTKLGTGGLARAYAQAVNEALDRAQTIERMDRQRFTCEMDYAHLTAVESLIAKVEGLTDDKVFAAGVKLTIQIPVETITQFERQLAEITSGSARLESIT